MVAAAAALDADDLLVEALQLLQRHHGARKEEKWIKRLEILGASAAVIVIVSAVGTFLLDSITMQLMALAVGCGSIVNVVLMVLCYYKKKTVPSIIFMIFALLLIATFIMQIMAM